MSIIGIDIGSSTIKIVEYKNNEIINKLISENKNYELIINNFIEKNNVKNIDRIVLTGINAKKVNISKYKVPVNIVEEFIAIGTGGLYLSKKDKAIIASIGTGTALIRAENGEFKHLGGTGVGAGTLVNLCRKFAKVETFEEIINLANKGNLDNIDLRIKDLTDENIKTLPPELTLANFGKLKDDASKEDIVTGIVNMIFEVIGMMTAFATINDDTKDVILIGNIVTIPIVKDILNKIVKTHNLNFIVPENPQYGVAIGAVKSLKK